VRFFDTSSGMDKALNEALQKYSHTAVKAMVELDAFLSNMTILDPTQPTEDTSPLFSDKDTCNPDRLEQVRKMASTTDAGNGAGQELVGMSRATDIIY
jgi:hypothetical protein